MSKKLIYVLLFIIQLCLSKLPTKIIVVMFENRSFDNVLGYLHNGTSKASEVEGVIGKNICNPVPNYCRNAGQTNNNLDNVCARPGTVFNSPSIDPGESYPHTMTQIYGDFIPSSNYEKKDTQNEYPYNVPPNSEFIIPNMQGFILDYASVLNQSGIIPCKLSMIDPNLQNYSTIMHVLTKDQVPMMYGLAENFLVFDHWFCDVPSMTYPNRRFFQSATSGGYVTNHVPDIGENFSASNEKTIFNQLQSAKKSWKVYYPKRNVLSVSLLIDIDSLYQYHEHFVKIDEFFNDLTQGTLPDYSFVEPVFLGFPSDYHPTDSDNIGTNYSSILAGEIFLSEIYEAVKDSSLRDEIVLFIIFDEFGGTMDHIYPPQTNPPDKSGLPGEFNFTFDRLGGRVPAIMINSYIKPGSVYNDNLQHTSFLGFIRTILNISNESLTERDAYAPQINISKIFTDINIGVWPTIKPRSYDNPLAPINTVLGEYIKDLINIFHQRIENGTIRSKYDNSNKIGYEFVFAVIVICLTYLVTKWFNRL